MNNYTLLFGFPLSVVSFALAVVLRACVLGLRKANGKWQTDNREPINEQIHPVVRFSIVGCPFCNGSVLVADGVWGSGTSNEADGRPTAEVAMGHVCDGDRFALTARLSRVSYLLWFRKKRF